MSSDHIVCTACNTPIQGKRLLAHLTAHQHTQIHETNIAMIRLKNKIPSQETNDLFRKVKQEYPDVFVLKNVTCRVCDLINFGKNFSTNKKQHVTSQRHVDNTFKSPAAKTKSIDSFLTIVAKQSSE